MRRCLRGASEALPASASSGVLGHACEAAGSAPGADQLAEHLAEGERVLVLAAERGLRSGLPGCPFTRSTPNRFVGLQLVLRCVPAQDGGETGGEVDGVLQSDVERRATGVEEVGGIAGEE